MSLIKKKLAQLKQNRPLGLAILIMSAGAGLVILGCLLPFTGAGWFSPISSNLFGIDWKRANLLFLAAILQLFSLYHRQAIIPLVLSAVLVAAGLIFVTQWDQAGSWLMPFYGLIGARLLSLGILLSLVGSVAYLLLPCLTSQKLRPTEPAYLKLLGWLMNQVERLLKQGMSYRLSYLGMLLVLVSLFLPFELFSNAFGISPIIACLALILCLWSLRSIEEGQDIVIRLILLALFSLVWFLSDRGVYAEFGFSRRIGFYGYLLGVILTAVGVVRSRIQTAKPIDTK